VAQGADGTGEALGDVLAGLHHYGSAARGKDGLSPGGEVRLLMYVDDVRIELVDRASEGNRVPEVEGNAALVDHACASVRDLRLDRRSGPGRAIRPRRDESHIEPEAPQGEVPAAVAGVVGRGVDPEDAHRSGRRLHRLARYDVP
jgi:hypothetical protein